MYSGNVASPDRAPSVREPLCQQKTKGSKLPFDPSSGGASVLIFYNPKPRPLLTQLLEPILRSWKLREFKQIDAILIGNPNEKCAVDYVQLEIGLVVVQDDWFNILFNL